MNVVKLCHINRSGPGFFRHSVYACLLLFPSYNALLATIASIDIQEAAVAGLATS